MDDEIRALMTAYGDNTKAFSALDSSIKASISAAESSEEKCDDAIKEIVSLKNEVSNLQTTIRTELGAMKESIGTYKWIIGILVTLLAGVLGSVGLYRAMAPLPTVQPTTVSAPAMESTP